MSMESDSFTDCMMLRAAAVFEKLAAYEGVDCRIEIVNGKYIVNGLHNAGTSVHGLYDWLNAKRKNRASPDAL